MSKTVRIIILIIAAADADQFRKNVDGNYLHTIERQKSGMAKKTKRMNSSKNSKSVDCN